MSDPQKAELKAIHATLDLVKLKAQIDKAIDGRTAAAELADETASPGC